MRKINCAIQWIEIYPLYSAIHLLNNRGQDDFMYMAVTLSVSFYLSILYHLTLKALRVISIKFLLVISVLCKTEWS